MTEASMHSNLSQVEAEGGQLDGTSERDPGQAHVATNRPSLPTAEAVQTPTQEPNLVGREDNHRCPCLDLYPNRGGHGITGRRSSRVWKAAVIRPLQETHDRRRAPNPPTYTGTHAQDSQPSLLPGGLQAHEASPAGISPVRRRRIYHRTVRSLKGDYNAQDLTCSQRWGRRGRLYGTSVAVWVVGWSKL